MELDEAIKFNTALRKDLVAKGILTFAESIQLGIEALKRCKVIAEGYQYWRERPLPGETTEEERR